MKELIYISKKLYNNKTGGGHNFLRSLVKLLEKRECYSQNVHYATSIIINSHQNFVSNLILRIVYPKKKFILRIDGKTSLHRTSIYWDNITEWQAKYLADSIIFQSEWSEKLWKNSILKMEKKSIVIQNTCNREIFQPSILYRNTATILKVISSANSNNRNKGLEEIYKLDEIIRSLKISKYEIRVFGYGAIATEHISKNFNINPQITQFQLASELQKSDVFFAPFKNEACSNSIIESLACGVPVLAKNSGGNPELINGNGILYNSTSDLKRSVLSLLNQRQNLFIEAKHQAYFYSRDISSDYLNFALETQRSKNKMWPLRALAKLMVIFANRVSRIATEYFSKRIH